MSGGWGIASSRPTSPRQLLRGFAAHAWPTLEPRRSMARSAQADSPPLGATRSAGGCLLQREVVCGRASVPAGGPVRHHGPAGRKGHGVKLRIYLDTSVLSAYADSRTPERQQETVAFWSRLSEFQPSTSELARQELAAVPGTSMREELLGLLTALTVVPVTGEMTDLAHAYVEREVFRASAINDAVHVAAAVLTRQDILVSWSFRHLVNRRRRANINDANMRMGFPTIEILAPPEI